MIEHILEMNNIKKSFNGVKALVNGRLEIVKGEVHGLIGENGAGKSTLMKILLGLYQADSGSINYKEKPVSFKSPSQALANGISMIHQEISLVPQMSVLENILLGQENKFVRFGILDVKAMFEKTRKLLKRLKINIEPDIIVRDLSIANMQLVEIARAVSWNSEIIIMDEPTSALTDKEIDLLYDIVKDLAQNGVSIVFISHKLDELFLFCSRVTIMRDGEYIETFDIPSLTKEKLIKGIVGRDLNSLYTREKNKYGNTVLEVKNIGIPGKFENISFGVRSGEIIGFSGLMGAGRTEIMRSIFGADHLHNGKIYIDGRETAVHNPSDAMKNRIGMVTEDRLRQGCIYTMSIMENATIASLKLISNALHIISKKTERKRFNKMGTELSLKYNSTDDLVGQLSGGNQQKIMFSRWLLAESRCLIFDEPTRGIDVGAKNEIYRMIDDLSRQGLAIIVVSSEIQEILSLCDHIYVVREGKIVYDCDREDSSQEIIMKYAFGA